MSQVIPEEESQSLKNKTNPVNAIWPPQCYVDHRTSYLPGMLTRPEPHEAEAEATTHEAEAEATSHEAEAEATTHEAEAEAEAKTSGVISTFSWGAKIFLMQPDY